MLLTVHVKTRAQEAKIQWLDKNTLKAWVKSAPEKGKANQELVDLLSMTLNVGKNNVEIVRGHTTTLKQVEIKNRA